MTPVWNDIEENAVVKRLLISAEGDCVSEIDRERATYVSSAVHQEWDPLPKAFICMHVVEASYEMRKDREKEKQNQKSEIIHLIMSLSTEVNSNSNFGRLKLWH